MKATEVRWAPYNMKMVHQQFAWFKHRTKHGAGHNWEGASGGSEADMYDKILSAAKKAGFNITEMVTDKDSSMNAIYCRHFPEGTIKYCRNHSAKTICRDLQKVKQLKWTVSKLIVIFNVRVVIHEYPLAVVTSFSVKQKACQGERGTI